jgi:hypothetical protein
MSVRAGLFFCALVDVKTLLHFRFRRFIDRIGYCGRAATSDLRFIRPCGVTSDATATSGSATVECFGAATQVLILACAEARSRSEFALTCETAYEFSIDQPPPARILRAKESQLEIQPLSGGLKTSLT